MNTKIITAFSELGSYLQLKDKDLQNQIEQASNYNPWFNKDNVALSIDAWANLLTEIKLNEWLISYKIPENFTSKKIGLILAGNIPLVGFHDILCVLISGNEAHIKLSSQDNKIIPFLLNKLIEIEPSFKAKIFYPEKLNSIDAIIATGSDNSSRYFEYYFSKYPHIIRKNRNSVAIITGNETDKELLDLGIDIFSYFGLGCRNVSKIYIPKDYSIPHLLDVLQVFEPIADFHKYNNNYDYQKSILLVNREPHLDNGFLLLRELESLQASISVLHYEYYDDIKTLERNLDKLSDKIQCIATNISIKSKNQVVNFGNTQKPELADYADGVDTLDFLIKLAN